VYRHLLGEPAPATPVLGGALAQADVLQRVARQSGLARQ
jgi:hypothetical protein